MTAIVRTTPRTVHDWSILLPTDVIVRETLGNNPQTLLKLDYNDGIGMFDGMARVLGVQHLSTLIAEMTEENRLVEVERSRQADADQRWRDDRMNTPA